MGPRTTGLTRTCRLGLRHLKLTSVSPSVSRRVTRFGFRLLERLLVPSEKVAPVVADATDRMTCPTSIAPATTQGPIKRFVVDEPPAEVYCSVHGLVLVRG